MFSPANPEPELPMVSTFGPWCWLTATDLGSVAAPTSGSWESADRAVYTPILVPCVTTIRRVWWANGGTVSGGATIEVGIYASSGYLPTTKLVSGSATQGNATEVQFVDVTDTPISPGLYYLALAMSSVTNTTAIRSPISVPTGSIRQFEQASAMPLPATATPVTRTGNQFYLFGFATTASP